MHILTEQEIEFLREPEKFKSHPNRRKIKHKINRKIQLIVSDFTLFCENFDDKDRGYAKGNVIQDIRELRQFLNKKNMVRKFPLKTEKVKIPKRKEIKLKIKKS